jgi:iron complex transport system ATP-binding protein
MRKYQPHITLEGKGLTLGYRRKNSRKEVLRNLDFQLFQGELTCLLGPNGVGKSTLIKAILGHVKPWAGEIRIDEEPIQGQKPEQLAKRISVVLTDPVFPGNMTVGQLVALGRTPHTGWLGTLTPMDREIVEKALSDTKTNAIRDERLSEISDGQRQKAMVARALAQDGQLIILDEPTAHLDLENRLEIMHLLRDIASRQRKSVLVVTHDLDIALETADRFWLMGRDRALISGLPEDLILSGQIDLLLPTEKYRFNLDRGKVEQKSTASKNWTIEADPSLRLWVEKALEKAGIAHLTQTAFVKREPFAVFYKEMEFNTLADFIDFLKN